MNLLFRISRFFRSLPFALRRTRIKAVHEDDLHTLITSLGIADDVIQGRYQCICCNSSISLDNLWGIISREGSIQLICSDPECLSDIV